MRICFVVQRYGADVAGGAEALCRRTARALVAAGDDVTVHTTTARDYLTWAPHHPEGESREDGVRVVRHGVERPDPATAAALVRHLALDPGDPALERRWARAQGPVAPGLLRSLADERSGHEVFGLWTYLYATTQMAAPIVGDRAALVPLAHEEPMLRFGLTGSLMASVAGFAFMTPEEHRLVADLHGPLDDRPQAVVGTGVDAGRRGDAARARRTRVLPRRFVLALGRVDAAKGVDDLIRAHARYRAAGGRHGLVLAGRAAGRMRVPAWVRTTGFVDERDRADLLAAAGRRRAPEPLREPLAGCARGVERRAPDARQRPLRGARRPDAPARAAGCSTTARTTTPASSPAWRATTSSGRCSGDAGRRFADAQTWPAAARRWRALLARLRRPVSPGRAPTPARP